MDGNKQHTFAPGSSAGNVSCVGNFDENGLNINNWNANRNYNVGLGASRNSHLPTRALSFFGGRFF
ncbi:MAG: hypothetical protein G01um101429_139 [Parcubacteria group bacterium Gr01-1014_29]|nr:MAG: hypothetical protein G01um101429_139 [Parcubacteria group bacterium Gr01-1014_29]